MRHLLCLTLGIAMLAGCANTSSSNVKTSGITANYKFEAKDGASVAISVSFWIGTTSITLDGGDNFNCEGQGVTETKVLGVTTYSKEFSRKAAGESYSCVFTRPGEKPYETKFVMPEEIKLQALAGDLSIAKDTDLSFAKGGASDATWRVDAKDSNCIKDPFYTGKVDAAAGTGKIAAGTIAFEAGKTSCDATVRVAKKSSGAVPAGLGGGSVDIEASGEVNAKIVQ